MRQRLGLRLAALLMVVTAMFGTVACSPQQRGGGDKEQSDQGSKNKSSDKSSDKSDGGSSGGGSSDGGSSGGSSSGGSSSK